MPEMWFDKDKEIWKTQGSAAIPLPFLYAYVSVIKAQEKGS